MTLARELEGSGANVLVLDRKGRRAQTSACVAPTEWLELLELDSSIRQTFSELVVHTTRSTARWPLPFSFSTFDYPELCGLLRAGAPSSEFETATVEGVEVGPVHTVHTDRGDVRAPYVIDALGWRRVLSNAALIQPPEALLSRGLEVHPSGAGEDLEIWVDPRFVRAGYSWSFPARDELRVGVGSFRPRDHVKDSTVALAGELGLEPVGYQGNWIPHQLRAATENGVFFVGDSAGHCFPLTAEGIRPAFYSRWRWDATPAGAGRRDHARAGARPLQRVQRAARAEIPHAAGQPADRGAGTGTAPMRWLIGALRARPLAHWAFMRYLQRRPDGVRDQPEAGLTTAGGATGLQRPLSLDRATQARLRCEAAHRASARRRLR